MSNKEKTSNCVVLGCHSSLSSEPDVKFYSFFGPQIKAAQKEKWISVIRQRNPDQSLWEPNKVSRICSLHFIGNKKSNRPQSPNFLPTIFPTETEGCAKRLDILETSVKRQSIGNYYCNKKRTEMQYSYDEVRNTFPQALDEPLNLVQVQNSKAEDDTLLGTVTPIPCYDNDSDEVVIIKNHSDYLKEDSTLLNENVISDSLDDDLQIENEEAEKADCKNTVIQPEQIFLKCEPYDVPKNYDVDENNDDEVLQTSCVAVQPDQKDICVKSEVDEEVETNEDNDDQSFAFEMPECDVQIELQDGPVIKNESASTSDHEEVTQVICESVVDGTTNYVNDSCQMIIPDYYNDEEQVDDVMAIEVGTNKCFECHLCQQVLRTFNELQIHLRDSHGKKKFNCDYCGLMFNFMYELRHHHTRMHWKSKFKCKYCEARFVFLFELRNHLRINHSEADYKCSVCGKTFLNHKLLQSHILLHENFQCSLCSKSFATALQAREHLSAHLKDEKFNCGVCGKEFMGNLALQKHLVEHRLDPVKCHVCNNRFISFHSLEKHVKSHENTPAKKQRNEK